MKIGTCYRHGRIMLHPGKCHDCRNEEIKIDQSGKSLEILLMQVDEMIRGTKSKAKEKK